MQLSLDKYRPCKQMLEDYRVLSVLWGECVSVLRIDKDSCGLLALSIFMIS